MRKALSILSLPLLILVLGFGLNYTMAPESPVEATITSTPTATPTLPACESEDGSGQMLCYWDADTSGNGMGTDVVAGDCSLGTVGTQDAMLACLKLWPMGVRMEKVDGTGAISETMPGRVLVDDCLTIEFEATQDEAIREQLNAEGWNLAECFEAHL